MPKPMVEVSSLARQFAFPMWEYYGLRLHQCIPMRNVVGLVMQDGSRYIWKPIRSSVNLENLPLIAAVASRLQRLGVDAAGPLLTKSGSYLSVVNAGYPQDTLQTGLHQQGRFLRARDGMFGYLQPWLSGRHVQLDDRQERLGAIASICVLHRFTRDITEGTIERTLLQQKLEMKRSFFVSSLSLVKQSFPRLCKLEGELLSGVKASRAAMSTLRNEDRAATISFCHRDLAAHNLLWQEDRAGAPVGLIDFDLAAPDDALGDVVQFANHALLHGPLTRADWCEITDVYADLARVSVSAAMRLKEMLRFPDVLSRACAEWLRTPNPETAARVHRAIALEEMRLQFCNES